MYLLPAPPTRLLLPAPAQRLALPRVASRKVRVFSFGGGVQSTAVMVMQAQGKLPEPYDLFVFANVGIDSENPDTLAYLETYTKPYCEQHSIEFVEVRKLYKKQPDTLMAGLYRAQKSIIIPARMGHNGALGNRNCTDDYKIAVVDRYLRTAGYTHAITGLGISVDEWWRMRDPQWYKDGSLNKRREYPLIDARINRQQCKTLIDEAGLPVPPKSSCFFCPFHKRGEWQEMKRERPDLFWQAVAVEREINRKRTALRKDRLYLHPDLVPLDRAVGDQLLLFSDEAMSSCDSGYCWT